jgi:hypothetical protein
MEWNASPEIMSKIRASIARARADAPLFKILAEDFPRDCSHLPISGGWGYTRPDAIVFIRSQFPVPGAIDFVSLERHIAQKIIYEELIIFRPKEARFSGINLELSAQHLIEDGIRKYDHLEFVIKCWSDFHWNLLKAEWEENDFGKRLGFDGEAHASKRSASEVTYERDFWFEITDVFNRPSA